MLRIFLFFVSDQTLYSPKKQILHFVHIYFNRNSRLLPRILSPIQSPIIAIIYKEAAAIIRYGCRFFVNSTLLRPNYAYRKQ